MSPTEIRDFADMHYALRGVRSNTAYAALHAALADEARRTASPQSKVMDRLIRRIQRHRCKSSTSGTLRGRDNDADLIVTLTGGETRVLVILPTGKVVQRTGEAKFGNSTVRDPHWRSNFERWHADALTEAAQHRRQGRIEWAHRCLREARRYRTRLPEIMGAPFYLEAAE